MNLKIENQKSKMMTVARKYGKKVLIAIASVCVVNMTQAQTKAGATKEKTMTGEMVFVEGNGTVKSFYIGKYEVTQGQWEAMMGSNPSCFKSGSNYPVEQVSWIDVQEFISRLNAATGKNFRLPTEAEWEYAASGGNKKRGFEYSGSSNINDVAWYTGNSGNKTHPVGAKQPNELGIYDMSGNVWEWCQDWYDAKQNYRVQRGGSWRHAAGSCRVTYRITYDPVFRDSSSGFRLVLP